MLMFIRCFVASVLLASVASARPNVVVVITDDQGYGDLGCHGNEKIRTPHIDEFYGQSVSMSDYHVAPTCSPTRAALLTGHWTNRTGVWHTIAGRSMLRSDETTLGNYFQAAGYRTGMFGKWHLGDNFPYRAEDRGFAEVYRHGGGGVGQTPDHWDNAYFGDTYLHNGHLVQADGFCTDVFFNAAIDFIETSAKSGEPFLAYLATNAPHSPLHAPPEYLERYKNLPPAIATFYAMITNIDDNFARLRQTLRDLKIEDDTILIFTTDNGTALKGKGFDAGMKGRKGSPYEGGHRVPLMVRWPGGGIDGASTESTLCHAVDFVPTLLDLCDVEGSPDVPFDGTSLVPILQKQDSDQDWSTRILVTDSQRVRDPIKWRQSCVMSGPWRLVNENELYNIKQDPGQQKNIIESNPEIAGRLVVFYEAWWKELEPTFANATPIVVGHPAAPVVTMTAHDWITDVVPPWNQAGIRAAKLGSAKGAKADFDGYWQIDVASTGTYQFELRRWPPEADQPITASVAPGQNVPGADRAFRVTPGQPLPIGSARLRVDGNTLGEAPVDQSDRSVTLTASLAAGRHQLAPVFVMPTGEVGVYYCTVMRRAESNDE